MATHTTDPRKLLEQMLLVRAYEEAIVAGSQAAYEYKKRRKPDRKSVV